MAEVLECWKARAKCAQSLLVAERRDEEDKVVAEKAKLEAAEKAKSEKAKPQGPSKPTSFTAPIVKPQPAMIDVSQPDPDITAIRKDVAFLIGEAVNTEKELRDKISSLQNDKEMLRRKYFIFLQFRAIMSKFLDQFEPLCNAQLKMSPDDRLALMCIQFFHMVHGLTQNDNILQLGDGDGVPRFSKVVEDFIMDVCDQMNDKASEHIKSTLDTLDKARSEITAQGELKEQLQGEMDDMKKKAEVR